MRYISFLVSFLKFVDNNVALECPSSLIVVLFVIYTMSQIKHR
jgi:hypothetical protein